ncbi:CLC_0170 family protein [Paenibacillus caui]|uniref:CLC_0170 family protein n=1 Tax=Paenibacillus caui TaxID=2873927 RepID=UPI003080B96A
MRLMIYVVTLFFVSGIVLLFVDRQVYRVNGMWKEKFIALALGWIQLCLFALFLIGSLVLWLLV